MAEQSPYIGEVSGQFTLGTNKENFSPQRSFHHVTPTLIIPSYWHAGPSPLLEKKTLKYFVLFVCLFLSITFWVPHSSSLNMVESQSIRVDIERNVEKGVKKISLRLPTPWWQFPYQYKERRNVAPFNLLNIPTQCMLSFRLLLRNNFIVLAIIIMFKHSNLTIFFVPNIFRRNHCSISI